MTSRAVDDLQAGLLEVLLCARRVLDVLQLLERRLVVGELVLGQLELALQLVDGVGVVADLLGDRADRVAEGVEAPGGGQGGHARSVQDLA
ncbi:MAG: hypothetical protein U0838_13000 [Chloroflexota bacterium]